MLINRLIAFLTSLRLTVACLFAAIALVFFGTLAQVDLGLYVTQEEYFRSIFVFWSPEGSSLSIPVLPGGYLLGGVLLANLIAAHIKRFKFTWKKSGIFLTHIGVILLLVGQFLTEVFQVESFMRIEEGETMNYSENGRGNELAVIDVTAPDSDKVVGIPQSALVKGAEIRHPELPFSVRVKEFFPNSTPGGPMTESSNRRMTASQGAGQSLPFDEQPITAKMDEENIPSALIEVIAEGSSLGDWTLSTWLTKVHYRNWLSGQLGTKAGGGVLAPQEFNHDGHTYRLALRPIRYYKPYSLKLLDFTHARYKGTEIAKDFSSRIHLTDSEQGVERDALIYMNNPLRYGGETYYQGSFERGDKVSILQVVRNPAWLTPYLSCILVGVGLTVQFGIHLARFLKKSGVRTRVEPASQPRKRPEPAVLETVGVTSATTGLDVPKNKSATRRRKR